jgi:iron complex outermembrane receptor protein
MANLGWTLLSTGLVGALLGVAVVAPRADEAAPEPASSADTPAAVDAPPKKGIEEIVVTGRKREEAIQETPISMVAFTEADLEIKSVTEVQEIGQNVAGLKFDTTVGSNNQARVYIRGVGQDSASSEVDPGVGIYVDGVYYPRALGSTFSLVDIERIEVLRGPQGTLYGKNTIGGLINVITRKPAEEFGGRAQVRVGNFGLYETRTSIDIPLVPERAYSRISVATGTSDGYLRNGLKSGERLGDNKLLSARLALRLMPFDDVEANFTFDRSQENEKAPVGECRRVTDLALSTFVIDNTSRFREGCAESRSGDKLTVFAQEPTKTDLDIQGATGIVSWDLDAVSLKSTSSWRQVQTHGRGGDTDGTRVEFLGSQSGGQSKNNVFSQELLLQGRLLDDKLFFSTGVYGLRESGKGRGSASVQRNLVDNPDVPVVGLPPEVFDFQDLEDAVFNGQANTAAEAAGVTAIGDMSAFEVLRLQDPARALEIERGILRLSETVSNFNRFNTTQFTTLSYAAFGELTYDVTDKLSVTGGLRVTHERKERQGRSIRPFPNPLDKPGLRDRFGVAIDERFADLSGRAIVNYKWSDDIFTYVSFSRGFRSGGFNETTVLEGDVASVDPFDDERLESLEVGLKTTWLDNRLLFNVTGFYNNFDGIQLGILTVGSNGLGSNSTENAGGAIVQGLELEFQARPSGFLSNFSFNAGVSFINADYKSFRTDIVDDFDSSLCSSLRVAECNMVDPDGPNGPETSNFAKVLTALANPGDRTRLDVDVSDRDFKQTPPFSFNVGVTHDLQIGDWGSLLSNVQWYHQGATFQNTANSKSVQQPKFGLLSARVAWSMWDGKTTVAFFGRNLLDRRYIAGALDLSAITGTNQAFFAPPRTYGIEIIRTFGR